MSEHDTKQLLPTRLVCRRYGICDRTIARWERDANLRFPKPVVINRRKYFRADELDVFDRSRRQVAA